MTRTHEVEFTQALCLTLEHPDQEGTQLLQVYSGTRLVLGIIPRHLGHREVADLIFEGGATAREVSYGFFRFVDNIAA